MALLDLFRRRKPAAPQVMRDVGAVSWWEGDRTAVRGQSGWMAGRPSRLTADLPGANAFAPNRDIRWQLATLRSRSRWLAQNEGHTAGFLKMLRRNVVGPRGFALQMQVLRERGGGMDEAANRLIEAEWASWSRGVACDAQARSTWVDFCGLVMLGVARDGEAFIRHRGAWGRNRQRYAMELIDPSRVDEGLNGRHELTPAGHIVRAGIELDPWGAPAAYYVFSTTPNDDLAALDKPLRVRERVPVSEMVHLFLPEWPSQIRGVPWIANGIRALAMLDGYSEAELTAARVAAAKMGFYKMDGDAEPNAELEADGALVQEASAGSFELLPRGVDFQQFDPQHPNAAFADFVKAMLRPVAAGAGVSYNAFANDADGMNYSALRATELEDRDEFRTLQQWMIAGFCQPVFGRWLNEVLMAGITGLPLGKRDRFDAALFIPRGWQWVDPLKEVAALEKAIALGLTSRRRIVAAQGEDFEQIAAELAREAEMGFAMPQAGAAAPPDTPEQET